MKKKKILLVWLLSFSSGTILAQGSLPQLFLFVGGTRQAHIGIYSKIIA